MRLRAVLHAGLFLAIEGGNYARLVKLRLSIVSGQKTQTRKQYESERAMRAPASPGSLAKTHEAGCTRENSAAYRRSVQAYGSYHSAPAKTDYRRDLCLQQGAYPRGFDSGTFLSKTALAP